MLRKPCRLQTDGRRDGQTDKVNPVYPPPSNFVGRGYNDGILSIGPLRTNFSEIIRKIHTFSFKKMHLKRLSAKWRPFCLGLNELSSVWWLSPRDNSLGKTQYMYTNDSIVFENYTFELTDPSSQGPLSKMVNLICLFRCHI